MRIALVMATAAMALALLPGDGGAETIMRARAVCLLRSDAALSVTAVHDDDRLVLRWRGEGLVPRARMSCGYHCAIGGVGRVAECGASRPDGTWNHVQEVERAFTCVGLVPLASSGRLGECAAGFLD